MNEKKQENIPVEGIVDAQDFVELKRDMQSAKTIAWLQQYQQHLIAGLVVLALVLVGYSLWQEQKQTQKESAALMYMKALNISDKEQRSALLDSVIKDYADTGYATLALLQKAKSDDLQARRAALEALMASHGAPELHWQARLDLAELFVAEGNTEEARTLLEAHVGKYFEQPRYALLAHISTDKGEKIEFIQKALDAESNDNDLTAELETQLALLQASE